MTRPPHPGDFLKSVMQRQGLTVNHLLAAGCNAQWVDNIMRRQEEFPTKSRALAPTMTALATVTGISRSEFERVQSEWHLYARNQAVQHMQQRSRWR